MLLAIAGKFPGDYVDGRFDAPNGDLTANLGRMPVVEVGDAVIGQSAAMNYFLAAENGLMGSNNLEAAQIIAVGEHLKEVGTAWRALVPYGTEPSAEALEKWFTEGAKDVEGVADRAGYSTRFLTWWMGRIEKALGDKGFAVGDKISLADVLIYNMFGEFLKDEEAGELPAFKREPFGSKARTDAALAAHPKINASVQAVANNANVQKWLAARGPQGF